MAAWPDTLLTDNADAYDIPTYLLNKTSKSKVADARSPSNCGRTKAIRAAENVKKSINCIMRYNISNMNVLASSAGPVCVRYIHRYSFIKGHAVTSLVCVCALPQQVQVHKKTCCYWSSQTPYPKW